MMNKYKEAIQAIKLNWPPSSRTVLKKGKGISGIMMYFMKMAQ